MNADVVQASGVVAAAALSAFAVIYSRRSDRHADQAASVEAPTGMAGLLIGGWQDVVKAKDVIILAGEERERQLRVDLASCLDRARRARRARAE